MRTLNLGILAHVDAGKTSLTERLLHAAGVIDEIGSVDDGSTQTDSLALERQRGITIKSAVASFVVDDVTVNLIDTPGHPDFIAEVERVLNVLDGAVLVVSAVEGVQAQTRVLMRTLRRLRIPTLVFVNKVDRGGARYERVVRSITEKLTPASISMGSVLGMGTRDALSVPYGATDAGFTSGLIGLLADHDDAFLTAYVDDEVALPYLRLRAGLAAQTGQALVHPLFFGSAITGAGVDALIAGITELLPAAEGDADGPISGTVFKVERGPAGEKIAYIRMFSGTVRVRDRLRLREDEEGKVTAISVFERGSDLSRDAVAAGQIGRLWGLGDIRIGDAIGVPRTTTSDGRHFSPPTLETIVAPCRPTDRGALHLALTQLAEQDPLINLRQDDLRQETSVSLYGEVQKEVIQATLAEDFGVDVTFRETTTIHIERPVGTGAAAEILHAESNPFLATVGLRVEPAPIDTGVEFRLGVELGSMPFSFIKAVEETVRETLNQGLYGWQVTDCTVTLTHSGYAARQSHSHGVFDKSMSSTAGDFRNLTPLVLMSALTQAGTRVHEPMHRFHLDLPADVFGSVLPVLSRLRAVPQTSVTRGSSYLVEGEIPAASVHGLEQRLPSLTSGEGVLECAFDHYRPVRGTVPTRPRSDHDPLDRREYLLRVVRRVGGRGEGA
ncbi:ribosomal protection tetracycline resistance protein [Streptosporangium subroseum]|uniref:Ribosomal protection tetracycline resistance protein n=1 Tax=Streptosporangium subroseum TaxID=106412 RepID=A0A239M9Z9_9ACTN|nr:TetM/TetW/TetO/TetS family tetracycline resistance ribosomal protection protein [Streptosporangium subroseum]SNT39461.1 ribosomal protection tetracycline resistance protein [Streptosporangium subroseum]